MITTTIATTLLSITVFIVAAAGVGIGVLLQRKPPMGSCGGCANCLCKRKDQ